MAFSDIISTIFGGVDTSRQEQQAAANVATEQAIREGTQQARRDVLGIFPQAQQARGLGFQGALDILSQSIPAQLQAFQQGNIGAQGQVITGLPQFQAAILGQPTDFSVFQPTNISVPSGFTSQGVPLGQGGQSPQVQALINALIPQGAVQGIGQAAPAFGGGLGDGAAERFAPGERAGITSGLSSEDIAFRGGDPSFIDVNAILDNPITKILAAIAPGGIPAFLAADQFARQPEDIASLERAIRRTPAPTTVSASDLARAAQRRGVTRDAREGRTPGGAAGRREARTRGLSGRAR